MHARPDTFTFDDVVVVKHPTGTDATLLGDRLRVAAQAPWREVLLSPLSTTPVQAPDGRLLTVWPRVAPLDPGAGLPPWREVGELLARLHAMPLPELPPHGGRARLQRASDDAGNLRPGGATNVLRKLTLDLMRSWPEGAERLVHGDFHLGNVGLRADGQLVLLSVDALGLGDPAWDLGLPAGLFGAGLLPDSEWNSLLDGYFSQDAYARRQPWPALDHPARCNLAIAAIGEQHHDYTTQLAATLLETCVRMVK